MDAVEYLRKKWRMCKSCDDWTCFPCGFGMADICDEMEEKHPEEAVCIVEQWSREHASVRLKRKTSRRIDK